MKKKYIVFIILVLIVIVCILLHIKNKSSLLQISSDNIKVSNNKSAEKIQSELSSDYNINSNIVSESLGQEQKVLELANKVTFLIFGAPGKAQNNDYKDYEKRAIEFNKLVEPSDLFNGVSRDGIRYKVYRKPEKERDYLAQKVIKYKDYGRATIINSKDDLTEVKVLFSDVTIQAFDHDDPKKVVEISTQMEIRYFFKEIYGEYRIYNITSKFGDELFVESNEAEKEEIATLNKSLLATNIESDSSNSMYDYSQLKNVTEDTLKNIYMANSKNILLLNSYYDGAIVYNATGFILSDGYLITTWNFYEKSLKKAQYIVVRDTDDNLYGLDGLVSINTDLDIVVLKLKDKKTTSLKIGDSNKITASNPVITLSSKTGFKLSISSGINIENSNFILKNSLNLSESDEGSPLFDQEGNLIGINTAQSVNSSISIAYSTNDLISLKEKLDKSNFETISAISFEDLKQKYYYNKNNSEIIDNQLKNNIWNEYKVIGDIENTINLNLKKASYYNNIISLRYENDVYEYINSIDMASSFISKLKDSGYKLTYKSDKKYVFKNEKYKVTIMDEYNSLIILITKI